jgi:uncharacterized protein YfiM (DUF2279 family)
MKQVLVYLLLIITFFSNGQELILSDSITKKRMKKLVIAEVSVAAVTLVGLNKLWYSDYPKSKFHLINDNAAWLQMDKMGHFTSSYYMGALGASAMQWTGASASKQQLCGATTGLAFLTVVEIFDGYSSEWGASSGDMLANALGASLYIGQDLLWQEQRILPKYSFHTTSWASQRPNVLGTSFLEQALKDYNGQTYWLSFNVSSFASKLNVPKWLNIAVGYGAENMLTAYNDNPSDTRYRQFYLSLDVDLRKINTNSKLLKSIFKVVNIIKVPAPTLAFDTNNGLKCYPVYF